MYIKCRSSQLISHTINLLLHKINPTNFISQKFSDSVVTLVISVSKHCHLDLSAVKAQGSIAGFLFFLPFCHSRKIFTDHFVTARVEFGIAFSIKFLSSSPLWYPSLSFNSIQMNKVDMRIIIIIVYFARWLSLALKNNVPKFVLSSQPSSIQPKKKKTSDFGYFILHFKRQMVN